MVKNQNTVLARKLPARLPGQFPLPGPQAMAHLLCRGTVPQCSRVSYRRSHESQQTLNLASGTEGCSGESRMTRPLRGSPTARTATPAYHFSCAVRELQGPCLSESLRGRVSFSVGQEPGERCQDAGRMLVRNRQTLHTASEPGVCPSALSDSRGSQVPFKDNCTHSAVSRRQVHLLRLALTRPRAATGPQHSAVTGEPLSTAEAHHSGCGESTSHLS